MFEIPAGLLAWFYSLTNDYTFAIALIAVVVMAITTPLTLKSTKGMLEMQRLAPEMRKLQNEHRNDRQKLNEEMMKLYQEHKVNPAASCLPIVAQMPIFLIMFRILRGLVYRPSEANGSGPIAEATVRAIEWLTARRQSRLHSALFGGRLRFVPVVCTAKLKCRRSALIFPSPLPRRLARVLARASFTPCWWSGSARCTSPSRRWWRLGRRLARRCHRRSRS